MNENYVRPRSLWTRFWDKLDEQNRLAEAEMRGRWWRRAALFLVIVLILKKK